MLAQSLGKLHYFFISQMSIPDHDVRPPPYVPFFLMRIVMKTYLHATLLALGLAAAVPFVQAQTSAAAPAEAPVAPATDEAPAKGASSEDAEANENLKKLGAQTEGIGKIGSHAEIDIPEGYIFFPAKGAKVLMKEWGNLIKGNEDGLVVHDEKGWSVLFRFDEDGYVKDDDKEEAVNADKMLKAMLESEPDVNKALKEAGLPAQHITGFAMPPKYNEKTNNLEWAVRFTVEGSEGESVNYRTKLLGRKGVMTATLMVGPDELDAVLPEYQKLLAGYRYGKGETYAEYRQGDKLATYGLTGLVLGGGAFAAAKMGLFAKLGAVLAKGGKFVFAGIAVVLAVVGKFFGKLFGRRDQSQFNQ
jgi:uncharacterized membrane-anchored protein